MKIDCIRCLSVAGVLAGSVFILPPLAQSAEGQGTPSATQPPAASSGNKPAYSREVRVPRRAKEYYLSMWGVDNMLVHMTASGNLIRFSYRVNDPVRAKELGDKRATPYLYGQLSHAMLHIPVMDKVGQLRQSGTLEAGKEYWMVFSNKGNLVKVGDRVNVSIGAFHADGLIVE
jgi:hypothetical protein